MVEKAVGSFDENDNSRESFSDFPSKSASEIVMTIRENSTKNGAESFQFPQHTE